MRNPILATQKSTLLKLDPAFHCFKEVAGSKEEASPTSPWRGDHPGAGGRDHLEGVLHFLGQPKESFTEP